MSNMVIPASQFFEHLKDYQKNVDDNFNQPAMVISKLRTDQRRSIKWMIDRENNNDLVKSDGSPFSGGILADEMGLGKTVEMLCCILANSPPAEFYNKQIMIPNSINVTQNDSLTDECYCTNASSDNTLIVCAVCGKNQHAECVHFYPKPFQEVPFLCANCWTLNDKMQCKATLIVVPQCILNLWIQEIEKHIEQFGLNVLIYNGVHIDGYIQPISFNDYDIVITTFVKLSKDLNNVKYSDSEDGYTSRLRHSKKYNYPKSPLPCIKWWRICLDEGQSVTSKESKMISCLKSVHKWAMSGKPIQKSLHDLYGIIKFLDVGPYCEHKQFTALMNGEANCMYEWFSKIIWQNSIVDVNSDLNLPNVTNRNHWHIFSHFEKKFFITHHKRWADLASTMRILNFPCKHMDKKTLYKHIEPIYKLLIQTMVPQNRNQKIFRMTSTMTMKELMDVKIGKCRLECNAKLRSHVFEQIYLAEVYRIQAKPAAAVERYRNVLSLWKLCSQKTLTIDLFQKVRVLNSLAEILDEHTEISRDLGDSNLKNKEKIITKTCIDSMTQRIESHCKTVRLYADKVEEIIGNGTLITYSNWWSDLLQWISPSAFLIKVQTESEDYRITYILKSTHDIICKLKVWLTNINSARNETLSLINTLVKTSMNDLFKSASVCHLSYDVYYKNISRNRCLICDTNIQLESYGSMLFRKVTHCHSEEGDETVYESTRNDLWEMSQEEFLLMKLFQFGEAKLIKNNYLKYANGHMKVLKLIRKEFKYLRLLWSHLRDRFFALKKLVMAKERAFLYDSSVVDSLEPVFKLDDLLKKKSKQDRENDVTQLEIIISLSGARLEQLTKTLDYLQNLKTKYADLSETECPICKSNIDSGWAVLLCAHRICNVCLITMYDNSADMNIPCPLCRRQTPMDAIYNVKSSQEGEVSSLAIKGSFPTKIMKVTMKLIVLIDQDPRVKVLIISHSDKALRVLGEALAENLVNYRLLESGTKYKKTLTDFKTNANINALLMNLSLSSKELHLTEATRIFFMEPIINKARQNEAISSIHRIGQTKPIVIHHFITRDSIEENVTNAISNNVLGLCRGAMCPKFYQCMDELESIWLEIAF